MGNGRFKNGKFDMVVVANYAMTAADWTEWERGIKKASEILYNASEGQMQFGKIFVCDESNGLSTADIILYPAGDPSYSSGTFGNAGAALHIMPYVKRQVLTFLHEMGHHVWGLGDESCQPYLYLTVDESSPSPDNVTIPLADTGMADNELSGQDAQALLMFGGLYERRNVIADTATSITVDAAYPDLPTNADGAWVLIQIPAECAAAADQNYCIMERSRSAAGYFDAAGTWHDVPHPVTEYCSASNHDPDSFQSVFPAWPHGAQPDCRITHVPVQLRARQRQRLASHASGPVRDGRGRTGDHRSYPCFADCTYLAPVPGSI